MGTISGPSPFEVYKYTYHQKEGIFRKKGSNTDLEANLNEVELPSLQKLEKPIDSESETEETEMKKEDIQKIKDRVKFSKDKVSIYNIRNNTEKDSDGKITTIECSIRLDEIQDGEKGYITDCGFFITRKFFMPIALNSKDYKSIDCPMCRQLLKVDECCKKHFQQKKRKLGLTLLGISSAFLTLITTSSILYLLYATEEIL